jgi:hypothetical protein
MENKPYKIFNSIYPERILETNLSPIDTFLAKYNINSIV